MDGPFKDAISVSTMNCFTLTPGVPSVDAERRKAHVPEAIRFKTKPQIALAQLRAASA
jgi:hypothetical protein